jgi:Mg2+ and Co2+ transporter CorA
VQLSDESLFSRIASRACSMPVDRVDQLNGIMKILTVIARSSCLTFIGPYGMNVDLPHFGLGATAF